MSPASSTRAVENFEATLAKILHRVDLKDLDHTQYDLKGFLSTVLDVPESALAVAAIDSAPLVQPLLDERLLGQGVRLLIALVGRPEEQQAVAQTLAHCMSVQPVVAVAAVCTLSRYGQWFVPTLVACDEEFATLFKSRLAPAATIVATTASPAAARGRPGGEGGRLIMDARVLRMAKLAVASASAVVFVGPPGTGKTTLVRQLLQDMALNPSQYGLSRAPREPRWVTPSENWTALDLLGGVAADDRGRVRFRLGHVLEAIKHDRWLVLDEANRANMDRIFGPLLTWLSDQSVELGRACSDVDSPPVVLEWSDGPACETVRLDLLDADRIMTPEPIRFRAGQDWRLLGTYNAQDVVKVFSFGQALSRRFARVPIPPIRPSQFQRALAPLVKDLPREVPRTILGIYEAHLRMPRAQLGPAIFLRMASYISAGIRLPAISGLGPQAPVVDIADTDNQADPRTVTDQQALEQLLAEAYLTSAGTCLTTLSADDLSALGKAAVAAGLPQDQWDWIASLLPALG